MRKADRDGGQRDAVRALTETRTPAHQIQMKREAAVGTASDGVVMPDRHRRLKAMTTPALPKKSAA